MTDRLLHADRTLPGTARPRYVETVPGRCDGCQARVSLRVIAIGPVLSVKMCNPCSRAAVQALVPGLRTTELDLVR